MRIKKYGKKEEYASIDFVYTKYIQNHLVGKFPYTLILHFAKYKIAVALLVFSLPRNCPAFFI